MKALKKLSRLLIVALFVFSTVSYGQVGQNQTGSATRGPRKQMATIFLSGLAGAVVGLSTLSFHGRPQDHLSDIAIGFAVGAVAGTVFTTYDTAVQPGKYYGDSENQIKRWEEGASSSVTFFKYSFLF